MKVSIVVKYLFILTFVALSFKFYQFYIFIIEESKQNTNTCMYFACPVEKTINSCFYKYNYSFFNENTQDIKEPFRTSFLVNKLANCVDRTYSLCKEECLNVKINEIEVSPRFYKTIEQNDFKYNNLEFENIFLTIVKKCRNNNLPLPCDYEDF